MKSSITVVAAAIVKDGKLLALRRADGNEQVVHKFEFVGGKVEEGETPEQALIRECKEELSLDIEVGELLNTVEYDYPNTTVNLSVYFAVPLSNYKLSVHEEERWIDCNELDPSDWAPADKYFLGYLKKGYSKAVKAETDADYAVACSIAAEVMHEVYDPLTPEGQIDYMLSKLPPEEMRRRAEESGYTYKIVYLNGEAAGFYSFCPAKEFREDLSGTYLSKLYLRKFARGKKICTKILASLTRPIYLTVKRDNANSVNVFKHYGFKIVQQLKSDIGGGFVTDDYLMSLGK